MLRVGVAFRLAEKHAKNHINDRIGRDVVYDVLFLLTIGWLISDQRSVKHANWLGRVVVVGHASIYVTMTYRQVLL